eukprot:TRINITY_DN63851_c0_g1_i1.p1 TRINITY_DN63851_c0_g1~~TRINITY_DN63851_c0_g1_i1.p1  ORF type:complete len:131 (-),score=35.16 TRINITY_DN63851_c0_g1_i1:113-505(-)
MLDALERCWQQVELLKLKEGSFVDVSGHYMAQVGELLENGRYVVMGHCGTGAFCKAWHGLDVLNGDRVCIKIIGNKKLHSDQSRREIKILKFLADYTQLNPHQCEGATGSAVGGGAVSYTHLTLPTKRIV